jgi:GTP cyclohydrolase II
VIATLQDPELRNVIGTHAGAYALYRALAVAAGRLAPGHRPDLTDTAPAASIGPFPQWGDPERIVSLDPWGHMAGEVFADRIAAGWDIRPTIAVTRARINMPEIAEAVRVGRLTPDGAVLTEAGHVRVTKVAVEPVWYLPGVARRFGISTTELRRGLFEQTGGMFPELVTRPDLAVFLPPIGGLSVYIMGDPSRLGRRETRIACRVHDECNGSDVFGSDICTCRPYLAHGVEVGVATAQQGGLGVVVYNRKEGRALGEVTKFLVYNARKRQAGGDRAEAYFQRTECVAGVSDMRLQELMPDVLHWLGIARIDRLVSMSHLKYAQIVASGIEVIERVPIPDELIPADASVEMDAKKASGYYAESIPDALALKLPKGRNLGD